MQTIPTMNKEIFLANAKMTAGIISETMLKINCHFRFMKSEVFPINIATIEFTSIKAPNVVKISGIKILMEVSSNGRKRSYHGY